MREAESIKSAPTNRHALSAAQLFHASCGSRNDPGARATVPSRAILRGSPRFARLARSNRIHLLRTEREQSYKVVRCDMASSNEDDERRETAQSSYDAIRCEYAAPQD